MNNDDFTTAARAASEAKYPAMNPDASQVSYPRGVLRGGKRAAFRIGAEWARAHLAAQDLTHDEVAFGGLAMRDQAPDDTPDWPDWVWARFSRTALTAARSVGRDAR